jgi:hypothetical protein
MHREADQFMESSYDTVLYVKTETSRGVGTETGRQQWLPSDAELWFWIRSNPIMIQTPNKIFTSVYIIFTFSYFGKIHSLLIIYEFP